MGWWSGSGINWTICKSSAPRSRQVTTPASHHSSWCPTYSVKALKAINLTSVISCYYWMSIEGIWVLSIINQQRARTSPLILRQYFHGDDVVFHCSVQILSSLQEHLNTHIAHTHQHIQCFNDHFLGKQKKYLVEEPGKFSYKLLPRDCRFGVLVQRRFSDFKKLGLTWFFH